MARTKFLLPAIFTLLAGLAACSPSPLYVDRAQVGTFGEVPRDGRGQPIWSEIRPAPPAPQPETMAPPVAAPPVAAPQ